MELFAFELMHQPQWAIAAFEVFQIPIAVLISGPQLHPVVLKSRHQLPAIGTEHRQPTPRLIVDHLRLRNDEAEVAGKWLDHTRSA